MSSLMLLLLRASWWELRWLWGASCQAQIQIQIPKPAAPSLGSLPESALSCSNNEARPPARS